MRIYYISIQNPDCFIHIIKLKVFGSVVLRQTDDSRLSDQEFQGTSVETTLNFGKIFSHISSPHSFLSKGFFLQRFSFLEEIFNYVYFPTHFLENFFLIHIFLTLKIPWEIVFTLSTLWEMFSILISSYQSKVKRILDNRQAKILSVHYSDAMLSENCSSMNSERYGNGGKVSDKKRHIFFYFWLGTPETSVSKALNRQQRAESPVSGVGYHLKSLTP